MSISSEARKALIILVIATVLLAASCAYGVISRDAMGAQIITSAISAVATLVMVYITARMVDITSKTLEEKKKNRLRPIYMNIIKNFIRKLLWGIESELRSIEFARKAIENYRFLFLPRLDTDGVNKSAIEDFKRLLRKLTVLLN